MVVEEVERESSVDCTEMGWHKRGFCDRGMGGEGD